MKRFLLFGGYDYSSLGGWEDFIESFSTLEEAKEKAKAKFGTQERHLDWAHVIDTDTWTEALYVDVE